MKRNQTKKNKIKKSPLIGTQERLSSFQKKSPHKFRQVFEYHQHGQRKLTEGNVGEAKGSFENALSIYPEYIPAQNYLAVIYGMLGNFKEAFQFVKKVIKLDDRNVFALIQGAIFLFRLQRGKEAESYAQTALASYQEREGIDPYHDYDMLQKLVEMFSVLRLDKEICELYTKRKQQLSAISLYRSALAISNEKNYEEALLALRSIKGDQALAEKSTYLAQSIELFMEESIRVPLLFAEEDSGFEQLMAVYRLFVGEEKQKQVSLDYLNSHSDKWTVESSKKLLVSSRIEDWLKKAILSNLADIGETEKPVTVLLGGVMQEISLTPIELTLDEEMSDLFRIAKENVIEGNIQEAIEKFTTIEQSSPTYVPVYVELANSYLVLNQFDDAKRNLDKALEIAPITIVLLALSKYYVAVAEYQKSFDQLTRFDTRELENNSDVHEAIELKTRVTLELFGLEKAKELFELEKQKFQLVLNDWDSLQNRIDELFSSQELVAETRNKEDINEHLEKLKKDELVAIVKEYNIRGYSKLNKSGLIELIKTHIYDKGLWNK
ncbi:tetratricopeptide repeat protein [Anaerobacillus alkaliphilus]|nr:tetratricopeptide repeat protein [Anaerobacillus alkaliphilus]